MRNSKGHSQLVLYKATCYVKWQSHRVMNILVELQRCACLMFAKAVRQKRLSPALGGAGQIAPACQQRALQLRGAQRSCHPATACIHHVLDWQEPLLGEPELLEVGPANST